MTMGWERLEGRDGRREEVEVEEGMAGAYAVGGAERGCTEGVCVSGGGAERLREVE